jgi:ABC-2 type transport system ATP-binding protein
MTTAASTAPVVDVRGLRKTYRGGLRHRPSRKALDGLDLQVDGGGRVHGFLGPNGSGKTTTLRALLGLVRPDAGELRVLGHEVPRELPLVVGSVGALVEAPQFFRNFTGRRNLALLGDVAGLPRSRLDEVLELVELTDRADDLVRGYSLGMRQRLAIAATLLKRPTVLLLDEPSNGLDPAGIREVRALLRRLADEGTTVVLSSHLLAEVEQVCDEVTIVNHGRTVASGPVRDVLSRASGAPGRLRVGVDDQASATSVLTAAGLGVTRSGTHLLVTGAAAPSDVTRTLAAQGLYLFELTAETVGLEEAFLTLTEDAGHDEGEANG